MNCVQKIICRPFLLGFNTILKFGKIKVENKINIMKSSWLQKVQLTANLISTT